MFTKKDLIAKIAEKQGTPKTEAEETYNIVLESIKDLIKDTSQNGLDIYGVAKFEVVHQEAKERRNPSTGETFMADEKDVLKVKLSKKVKNIEF